jgi:hypothetical protein
MSALLVLCQQGPVVWRFRIVEPGQASATCVNDGFVVTLSQVMSANWVGALQSIGQHSVSLRGAIQQITVLPGIIG